VVNPRVDDGDKDNLRRSGEEYLHVCEPNQSGHAQQRSRGKAKVSVNFLANDDVMPHLADLLARMLGKTSPRAFTVACGEYLNIASRLPIGGFACSCINDLKATVVVDVKHLVRWTTREGLAVDAEFATTPPPTLITDETKMSALCNLHSIAISLCQSTESTDDTLGVKRRGPRFETSEGAPRKHFSKCVPPRSFVRDLEDSVEFAKIIDRDIERTTARDVNTTEHEALSEAFGEP